MGWWVWAALLLSAQASGPDLKITMIGNAGVLLSDGATSLMVDLPYQSGAFGYQAYDPTNLAPGGDVVSVITHHHLDHFDPAIFLPRDGWRILGPPSVTRDLPDSLVLRGDSVRVGRFSVVSVATPHTEDHRSYRIRWGGRVLHFVGDTEDPGHLADAPPMDVLFVTPWLSCAAETGGLLEVASRRIAYHLRPGGGDRVCGGAMELEPGASFTLEAEPDTGAGAEESIRPAAADHRMLDLDGRPI